MERIIEILVFLVVIVIESLLGLVVLLLMVNFKGRDKLDVEDVF